MRPQSAGEPGAGTKRRGPSATVRTLHACAAALAGAGAAWDAIGALAPVPPWWPAPGYMAIGGAVALGCIAVAAHVLTGRREQSGRGLTALRLVALGVLLGAWLLRGHHEIPADPPIVVAQLAAAAVLAVIAGWRT